MKYKWQKKSNCSVFAVFTMVSSPKQIKTDGLDSFLGFIKYIFAPFIEFLCKQQKLRLETGDDDSYNFYFAPRILQFIYMCRQSIWSTVATCWNMLVYLPSWHEAAAVLCFYVEFFSVYDHDLLFWLFLSQILLQEILKVAQTIPDYSRSIRLPKRKSRTKMDPRYFFKIIIIQENYTKKEKWTGNTSTPDNTVLQQITTACLFD